MMTLKIVFIYENRKDAVEKLLITSYPQILLITL